MKLRKNIEPDTVPLDLRDKLMILQRYALHWTFAEVGRFWGGLSRQRIQQITSEFEAEAKQYVKGAAMFDLNRYNGPGLP